ncbi:hypothetical protein HOY80DRAFT_252604 [Tuber brumale]|nr:hypothetical protein HOY80DRAFT_252604 [Tuber brumale]
MIEVLEASPRTPASASNLLFLLIFHLFNLGSTLCYLKPIHTPDIHLSTFQLPYCRGKKKRIGTNSSITFYFLFSSSRYTSKLLQIERY